MAKFGVMMAMVIIVATSINVQATDSRVTASHCEVVYNQSINASKATGYITSASNHYCSVKLFRFGNEIAYSGRKYGTGKVSNSTSYVECGLAGATMDGSAVYYGFK